MSRLIGWLLLAFLLPATLVIVTAGTAHSDGCIGASAGQDVFNAVADCESSATAATAATQGAADVVTSGITHSYQPVCVRGEGITGGDFYGCGEQMECGRGGRGHLFTVFAHHPDGTTEALGSQCFQPSEAPAAAATITAGDVLRAFRRIPVPASEVSIQPPGGETLVNLDTIFSTEADPFTRTIGLLGHRVELDITPAEFRWVNGDGTVQVTDWAGKPWTKGTPLHEFITHRYEDAAQTVQPRVDTVWTARYRVNGGAWQDVGGTVTITGEPFDLTVLSAEPHLSG